MIFQILGVQLQKFSFCMPRAVRVLTPRESRHDSVENSQSELPSLSHRRENVRLATRGDNVEIKEFYFGHP